MQSLLISQAVFPLKFLPFPLKISAAFKATILLTLVSFLTGPTLPWALCLLMFVKALAVLLLQLPTLLLVMVKVLLPRLLLVLLLPALFSLPLLLACLCKSHSSFSKTNTIISPLYTLYRSNKTIIYIASLWPTFMLHNDLSSYFGHDRDSIIFFYDQIHHTLTLVEQHCVMCLLNSSRIHVFRSSTCFMFHVLQ